MLFLFLIKTICKSALSGFSGFEEKINKYKLYEHCGIISTRHQLKPNVYKCKLCNKFHALKVCPKFLWMTPRERKAMVLAEVYCINCLARSHRFRDCRSPNMCQTCGRPHHTLLHASYHQSRDSQRRLRSSNNNLSQIRKPMKNASTNQQKRAHKGNRTTSKPAPNQQLLSEAIRALASVLCSSEQ
ncbi:uncharacterized protein LOC142236586 [Haematobia irritans]|uniref:uncharacterized protein LOC142236586 n=1 Tax=Haematobia irritans TaxID=7368 RepID=UPI003F505DD6